MQTLQTFFENIDKFHSMLTDSIEYWIFMTTALLASGFNIYYIFSVLRKLKRGWQYVKKDYEASCFAVVLMFFVLLITVGSFTIILKNIVGEENLLKLQFGRVGFFMHIFNMELPSPNWRHEDVSFVIWMIILFSIILTITFKQIIANKTKNPNEKIIL